MRVEPSAGATAKDPVCGMVVPIATALTADRAGRRWLRCHGSPAWSGCQSLLEPGFWSAGRAQSSTGSRVDGQQLLQREGAPRQQYQGLASTQRL